jgi:osmotically-inducible protein OsmY
VFTVDDELRVRLMDRDQREDAEIRGAALQRLMWDPQLVADYLNVEVKDGWVTLTGDVDHQYQSDKAFDHVASLYGVTGITNQIDVVEQL